jgi:RPA family protein
MKKAEFMILRNEEVNDLHKLTSIVWNQRGYNGHLTRMRIQGMNEEFQWEQGIHNQTDKEWNKQKIKKNKINIHIPKETYANACKTNRKMEW